MSFLSTITQGGRWMLQRLLLNMGPNDTSASLGFGVANVEQWRWEVRANATDGQGYQLILRDHKNGVDRLTISGYGSFVPFERDQVLGYGDKRWRDIWGYNLFLCSAGGGSGSDASNYNSILFGKSPSADGAVPVPFFTIGQRPDSGDFLRVRLIRTIMDDEVDMMSFDPVTGRVLVGTALNINDRSMMARQIAYTENVAFSVVTANIPADDTIPQSSEGTQILFTNITPGKIGNLLICEVTIAGAVAADGTLTAALFMDGVASAFSVAAMDLPAGKLTSLTFTGKFVTTGVALRTVSVRVGAASGNSSINGVSARLFGGVLNCSLTVRESAAN